MISKKEITALAKDVNETPGWNATNNAAGHWVLTREDSGEFVILGANPSNNRSFLNIKSELARLGWNPDAAQLAKDEKRALAMAADKDRAAKMLVAAQEHANQVLAQEQAEAALAEELAAQDRAAALKAQTEELRAQAKKIKAAATKAAETKATETKRQPPVAAPLFAAVLTTSQPTARKPTVNNPLFISPTQPVPEVQVPQNNPAYERAGHKVLAACRTELIYVGKEWAQAALEPGACRQRRVYDNNVALIQRAIENGDFHENPADHVVFDEHGCLVNGQHRGWGIFYADDEKMARHYPNGVPLYVAYGFDSRYVNIFDNGKNRSVTDSLAVDNVIGFGDSHGAPLRMLMNYDLTFRLPESHPNRKWKNWPANIWTKSEYTEAARGPYARLPEYGKLAAYVYKHGGAVHTAVAVAAFLFNRDNPNGSERGTNEEFWKGVCFEVPLDPKDPRGALYRYFQNARAEKNKIPMPGPTQFVHILRQYANWHIGEDISQVRLEDDWPVPAVWQDGFRWFAGGELRQSKYPSRVPARLKEAS